MKRPVVVNPGWMEDGTLVFGRCSGVNGRNDPAAEAASPLSCRYRRPNFARRRMSGVRRSGNEVGRVDFLRLPDRAVYDIVLPPRAGKPSKQPGKFRRVLGMTTAAQERPAALRHRSLEWERGSDMTIAVDDSPNSRAPAVSTGGDP